MGGNHGISHVCRLMLLAKSLSGEEVARQIISCISTEMGISSDLVIGAMHDRASVSGCHEDH